jgi:hypothetical protein
MPTGRIASDIVRAMFRLAELGDDKENHNQQKDGLSPGFRGVTHLASRIWCIDSVAS